MKFAQFQGLSKQKFKRRTGMSHQAYYVIVNEVKEQEKNKNKPGRTCKLSVEEQVLVTIQYWREYRPYFQIGVDWDVSESTVCRIVHKVENILIKSKKLSLPGQKELRKLADPSMVLVIDVMESPIEKPGLFHSKNIQNAIKTILTFSFCLGHIVKPCISI